MSKKQNIKRSKRLLGTLALVLQLNIPRPLQRAGYALPVLLTISKPSKAKAGDTYESLDLTKDQETLKNEQEKGKYIIEVKGDLIFDVDGQLGIRTREKNEIELRSESLPKKVYNKLVSIARDVSAVKDLIQLLPQAAAFVNNQIGRIKVDPHKKIAIFHESFHTLFAFNYESGKLIPIPGLAGRYKYVPPEEVDQLLAHETEKFTASECIYQIREKRKIDTLKIRCCEKEKTSEIDLVLESRFPAGETRKNPNIIPNLIRHGMDEINYRLAVGYEVKKEKNLSDPKLKLYQTKSGQKTAFIGAYSEDSKLENKGLLRLLKRKLNEKTINRSLNRFFDEEGTHPKNGLSSNTSEAIQPVNLQKIWDKYVQKQGEELKEIIIAVCKADDPDLYNYALNARGATYIHIPTKGTFHLLQDSEYHGTNLLRISSDLIITVRPDIFGKPALFVCVSANKDDFSELVESPVSMTNRKKFLFFSDATWDLESKPHLKPLPYEALDYPLTPQDWCEFM